MWIRPFVFCQSDKFMFYIVGWAKRVLINIVIFTHKKLYYFYKLVDLCKIFSEKSRVNCLYSLSSYESSSLTSSWSSSSLSISESTGTVSGTIFELKMFS